jgi:hypothetical protein
MAENINQNKIPDKEEKPTPSPLPPKEEKKEEKKEVVKRKDFLEANETGLLVGKNIEEQYQLAKCYAMSALLPSHFDTPEKVLTGMQYARELGLTKALIALRQICVINGKPAIYGDLPLTLVYSSKKMQNFKEYWFDKDLKEISFKNKNINAEIYGAYCCAERVEGNNITFREDWFTIDDAGKADLLKKDIYKKYLRTMLQYRTRAMVFKVLFPDVLNGISIAEYDHNIVPVDDYEMPIATTEEIKQDKTMSEYKKSVIENIKGCLKEVKELDPTFTEAKKLALINKHLGVEYMGYATEQNLEKFWNKLSKELEYLKMKTEEKKSE